MWGERDYMLTVPTLAALAARSECFRWASRKTCELRVAMWNPRTATSLHFGQAANISGPEDRSVIDGVQPNRVSHDQDQPTVLLVEDETLTRLMLSAELEARGYRVIEAANADEAVLILGGNPSVKL